MPTPTTAITFTPRQVPAAPLDTGQAGGRGVQIRRAGCSDCGGQELSWSPASTRYLSSGTETTTLSMNLQVVSGSISQSLLIHSASYGPTPNYPTSTQFQFEWDGDVGYTDVIGVAGGEEWQFNLSHGYPLYNYVTLYIVNA